jgi:hypothetical protein
LAFYPYPLRSPEAVANLKGIGTELLVVFNDMMKACSKEKTKPYCPPRGKFSSVAAASLIALDDYEREEKGKVLCSMEDLITRINSICHNPTAATHVFDRDAEYYLNKENIDPGWLQVSSFLTKCVINHGVDSFKTAYLPLRFVNFVLEMNLLSRRGRRRLLVHQVFYSNSLIRAEHKFRFYDASRVVSQFHLAPCVNWHPAL